MSEIIILRDTSPVIVDADGMGPQGPQGLQGPPGEEEYAKAETHGALGDGAANDAPAINAALAIDSVRLVKDAVYGVTEPVLIPSNRTLFLNGATIKILAGHTNVSGISGAVGAVADTTGITILGPGTIDGNKIGLGGADADRRNGVHLVDSTGFLVEGLTVKNCTGYATYAAGSTAFTNPPSGVFRRIETLNSQIHYEPQAVDGVTYEDCTARDGDGDVPCLSWFHPIVRGKNIFFERCSGVGTAGVGMDPTANSDSFENLAFRNGLIDNAGPGAAYAPTAGQPGSTVGLDLSGSTFIAANGPAITLLKTTGGASKLKAHGDTHGVLLGDAVSVFDIGEPDIKGTTPGGGGATAFGIQVFAGSVAKVGGAGTIEASGPAGNMVPVDGDVRIAATVDLVPDLASYGRRTIRQTHLSAQNNNGAVWGTGRIVWHYDPLTWAPANGGGVQGDIVINPNAGAGGKVGWYCITSGNPGTWKLFGVIDA